MSERSAAVSKLKQAAIVRCVSLTRSIPRFKQARRVDICAVMAAEHERPAKPNPAKLQLC